MKRQRILALLLALTMALSLAGAAGAEEAGDALAGAVVVIHTGGVQGALEGYDRVAAMKETYQAAGACVLLLDAGGFAAGLPYARSSQGASAVELMNAAGYDAAAVSESELGYGQEQLQTLAGLSQFPLLSANVVKGSAVLPAHQIFETDRGLKIGVFALTAPAAAAELSPSAKEGLSFLSGNALVRCANNETAALRSAGCELIICLSQLGLRGDDGALSLLRQVKGIDLLIDGRAGATLEEVKKSTGGTCMVGETAVTSTAAGFEEVGLAVYMAGEIVTRSLPLDTVTVSDEDVAARAKAIMEEVDREEGEAVGHTDALLSGGADAQRGETNLGDLACDAMLAWTARHAGLTGENAVDAVILSGGALRGSINAGDISRRDLTEALAVGQTLCTVRVTGAALEEALESLTASAPDAFASFPQTAGIDFTLNTAEAFSGDGYFPNTDQLRPAAIRRVHIDAVGGKAFDPEAVYTVAINSGLNPGAFSSFTRSRVNWGEPLEEVLSLYLEEDADLTLYARSAGRMGLTGYWDVAGSSWYAGAVGYVSAAGLMQGSDGLFRPGDPMSRAMLVTVLYRMAGSPAVEGASPFTDVPEGKYYTDAVLWALDSGIVQGQTADTFNPGGSITRQQLATFLYRYAGAAAPSSGLGAFADANAVSAYAAEAMAWSVSQGLISGVTPDTLDPKTAASRAMVATVLMRYLEE